MSTRLTLFIILILSAASIAMAQEKLSLRNMKAGEAFTDPDKRFSVVLPAAGFRTENEERNEASMKDVTVRYRWVLREGNFSISTHSFDKSLYDQPELIDTLMAVTMRRFADEGAEIISRTPIDVNGVHGQELVRKEPDGAKIIYRIFGWKNIMFTVNGAFRASDVEAGELMKKAVESFKFLELEKPPK